jgi:soluble lytic murein transglycosylase-like protein
MAYSSAATAAGAGAADAPLDSRINLVQQALAHEHGEGVRKDPLKAAALYCQAARQFDAEAIYNLGWMYANGRGIPREDTHAAALFAFAAALGHDQGKQALRLIGDVPHQMPACLLQDEASSPITQPAFAAIEVLPFGPDPFANLPPWKKQIADVVEKLAPRYAIDSRLALAVIAVESNFDRDAFSDKGAAGLMQLIPATAARFNVTRSFDVSENLRGGLAYLRWLLAYYQGRVPLAAAAYNAGEAAVDRYGGIPPYTETRDYVRRVLRLYGSDKHPYDVNIVDPSPVVRLQK